MIGIKPQRKGYGMYFLKDDAKWELTDDIADVGDGYGDVCWYCYWGWSKQVRDLYDEYQDKVGVDLDYGPTHILFGDENFCDDSVKFCLKEAKKHRDDYAIHDGEEIISVLDIDLIIELLGKLLLIPENIRDPEPVGYNGENPVLYPPPDGVEMVGAG